MGAAFLSIGLLLLLVGSQKNLPPVLAGGGGCIFAGLGLLAAVRRGAAPLLLLNGESGTAILCRRHLGRLAFRLFPPDTLEWTASSDGRHISLQPKAGEVGREIPGLPSHIADGQWRAGMTLPTPNGSAQEALAALQLWRRLARRGEAPFIPDACDGTEFSALMGKKLPQPLLLSLSGSDVTALQADKEDSAMDEAPDRPLRTPSSRHPEIRRAPDLRESSARRDKRD